MLDAASEKVLHWHRQVRELGMVAAGNFKLQRALSRIGLHRKAYQLTTKRSKYPLWVRENSSDLFVFDQIFIEREYKCLDDMQDASFIIDCGANVGYSAAYFLLRYPRARVVAIEPDEGNFEQLLANTSRFGARCRQLRAGVWCRPAGLVVVTNPNEYGEEWAYSVREAVADEPIDVPGIDLTSIWREAGSPTVSILKVDIEGSEKVVFDAAEKPWLAHVECIVVELHGEACRASFMAAIEGMGFELSTSGELLVCRRRLGPARAPAARRAGKQALLRRARARAARAAEHVRRPALQQALLKISVWLGLGGM